MGVCVSVYVCVCVYLHGVVGVLVVEDEGLLDELVVSLQLVDVGLVVDDVLLVGLQVVHLFLQRTGNVDGHMTDLLQRGRKGERGEREREREREREGDLFERKILQWRYSM